jgi:hypothetical protein
MGGDGILWPGQQPAQHGRALRGNGAEPLLAAIVVDLTQDVGGMVGVQCLEDRRAACHCRLRQQASGEILVD